LTKYNLVSINKLIYLVCYLIEFLFLISSILKLFNLSLIKLKSDCDLEDLIIFSSVFVGTWFELTLLLVNLSPLLLIVLSALKQRLIFMII
jgi:hypothetical protein